MVASYNNPFLGHGVISVQSEYLELESRGALVTGTPGIGKSVFLIYYLLAKILARKQPVFFHIQANTFVFLGPEVTDVHGLD
ncbi:hypothetical protein E1B28_008416 [Marasmius oreades]|uniref:Uncharacterized protein n=1 Tax=Marasmius oreades TaxID=181124 RepID=A0A9P7RZ09_9AGAR|nr:uncharacterized protein E1B28_008416 [Marasmius oreades]KAG7092035.1 hypothetical protein E1B28_008416 [Marasmius oreades]